MAEAVLSVAATTLGKLLIDEGEYLSGVKDKVGELKTALTRMQCFLTDADAWQSGLETVKQGIAEMKELAYEAQDIIEKYANTVATRKGGGVQKTLKRCCCILDEGIKVREIGLKIDAFKTKISNLETSFRNNGIRESIIGGKLSPLNASQRDERQTYPRLEHDVVGFDDDLKKLVEFLLGEEEGNRVASICGMGGLGKTTLAKMVYNHHEIEQHFVSRAWVYISQQCQRRLIWEEILIKVLSPTKEERNEIQK